MRIFLSVFLLSLLLIGDASALPPGGGGGCWDEHGEPCGTAPQDGQPQDVFAVTSCSPSLGSSPNTAAACRFALTDAGSNWFPNAAVWENITGIYKSTLRVFAISPFTQPKTRSAALDAGIKLTRANGFTTQTLQVECVSHPSMLVLTMFNSMQDLYGNFWTGAGHPDTTATDVESTLGDPACYEIASIPPASPNDPTFWEDDWIFYPTNACNTAYGTFQPQSDADMALAYNTGPISIKVGDYCIDIPQDPDPDELPDTDAPTQTLPAPITGEWAGGNWFPKAYWGYTGQQCIGDGIWYSNYISFRLSGGLHYSYRQNPSPGIGMCWLIP